MACRIILSITTQDALSYGAFSEKRVKSYDYSDKRIEGGVQIVV